MSGGVGPPLPDVVSRYRDIEYLAYLPTLATMNLKRNQYARTLHGLGV